MKRWLNGLPTENGKKISIHFSEEWEIDWKEFFSCRFQARKNKTTKAAALCLFNAERKAT